MATTFEIAIPLGTPHALDAAHDALDLVEALEAQLTVYRDASEVARLNAAAAAAPVVVEANLFALLAHAATLTQNTEGAFDAAMGRVIRAWGFFDRSPHVPTVADRAATMRASGMRHVVLNAETRTVRFLRGLEINLGGIGKGYALDCVADGLRTKWNIGSALVSGGGSSVVGIGHPPHDGRGWPVAIRHPHDASQVLATVRLRDAALGTSAATYQQFRYKGKSYGHLLDPRTGRPAEGTASASCVAPSGAEADALSTAFFVLGAAKSAAFVASRPPLGMVVLADDAPRAAFAGTLTT